MYIKHFVRSLCERCYINKMYLLTYLLMRLKVGPSSNHGRVEAGLMCTKARPHLIMIGGRSLPVTYMKTETET